jgi:putative transposase
MQRLSAPERTREELRALMNGDLGTAAGRGDLVRLALRLIVEEALEGEVSDVLGRERYQGGEDEKAGYRNDYRTGKVRTAEGAVEYSAPQVRETPEPFVWSVRAALSGRRGNSSGWRWSSMRGACRRATSRTRSLTRRAEGFCSGRR